MFLFSLLLFSWRLMESALNNAEAPHTLQMDTEPKWRTCCRSQQLQGEILVTVFIIDCEQTLNFRVVCKLQEFLILVLATNIHPLFTALYKMWRMMNYDYVTLTDTTRQTFLLSFFYIQWGRWSLLMGTVVGRVNDPRSVVTALFSPSPECT